MEFGAVLDGEVLWRAQYLGLHVDHVDNDAVFSGAAGDRQFRSPWLRLGRRGRRHTLYATVAVKQFVYISNPTGSLVIIHVVLQIRERIADELNPVMGGDAHKTRLQHMGEQRLGAARTSEETLAPVSAFYLSTNLTAVLELFEADP